MNVGILFLVCYGVWLAAGLVLLLPLKVALLRSEGSLTNDQLIQLAKRGNAQARQLRSRTWWFIGVGIALLLPLSALSALSKG